MRRSAIQSVCIVMKLYDEYEKENGCTNGIGKYVNQKTGMLASHIYMLKYYGNMLQFAGKYERAIIENWGLLDIRQCVKKFKEELDNTLKLAGKYEQSIKENWTIIEIVDFVKEFKEKAGTTVLALIITLFFMVHIILNGFLHQNISIYGTVL